MHPAVEEQFERFYREREQQVRRLLIGMLGDPVRAADAVQETWMRYLRYVEGPEPRFDVALLIAVARNVARDFWRRRRPESPSGTIGQASGGGSVEDAIVLADLVARLPYREREVIVMHYALDLPIEAICRQTGRSEGAVKSQLHRARERLRREFAFGEGERRGAR